jgi:8-oxo-dGTP pyrophosphatase MutT (NUDIX family)
MSSVGISRTNFAALDAAGEEWERLESNCALVIVDLVGQPHRMSAGKLELMQSQQPAFKRQPRAKAREQVAAVCFRILSTGVEFLLVRTRRGRWTFPKGGAQKGLTHAQSAALEALEEAGVHGRIEEIAFVCYTFRKVKKEAGFDAEVKASVHAHLCEVLRLVVPQEANRNPTWFSATRAKRRLAQGRNRQNATELARVIDRAVARIRRLPARMMLVKDPLLAVKFDASEIDLPRLKRQAASIGGLGASDRVLTTSLDATPKESSGKLLLLSPSEQRRP